MNCKQCDSGDNCERTNDIKFREYHDWLIPFKCKICQCSYYFCSICYTKRFESNKRKCIFIKKRVNRHLLYHSDDIQNKRIRFTELNKVRMKRSNNYFVRQCMSINTLQLQHVFVTYFIMKSK